MANEKVSAMPAASLPLTGTELVPLVQSGINVATVPNGLVEGGCLTAVQFAGTSGHNTVAHGLGKLPLLAKTFLKLLTTDGGYAAGTLIDALCFMDSNTQAPPITVAFDATNVYIASTTAWNSGTWTIVHSNLSFPINPSVHDWYVVAF